LLATGDARFVDQASAEKRCNAAVLDFDELMVLCKNTGAQPLLVVAYDAMYNTATTARPSKEQLITNATEWVRYANVTKRYGVKYWMIGNESWNLPDYNGQATPAQYAADLVAFATAMKAVDSTIKIIANGKSNWWQTLLQSPAVSVIDILAFSSYPVYDYTKGYDSFRESNTSLTSEVDAAVRAIKLYAPAPNEARIKVLASEYNSMDWSGGWSDANNLGHALCNFQMFGDMVKNPKVEGACLWNTRWTDNATAEQHIYDALDKNGNLNAIGIAQQVWGKNLLQTMVATTSSDAQVKVYASYDTSTQNLNIFLLNKDTASKNINLALDNYVTNYGGSKFVFSGTSTEDKFPAFSWAGSISNPAAVTSLTLAPASVTVLNLLASFIHLPVKLVSFNGAATVAGVQLKWQSENEQRLQNFVVEKRIGTKFFEAIGRQPAGQSEQVTTAYQFLDTSASVGLTNDYRLKLINRDGSISYSNVIQIVTAAAPELSVSIAPNPVGNSLQLRVHTTTSQTLQMKVTGMSGQLWTFEKVTVEGHPSVVSLPGVAALPKGAYWLHVQAGKQQKAIPFLKL